MQTEIGTATGTGTATAAGATATVATEMEAGGTERIGGVRGTGETEGVGRGGTEEMIALLSLNHQNVERAGGTTKEKKKKSINRIICATNCSVMSRAYQKLTQAQDCRGDFVV